ncbi:MAG: RloB family protein [Clostridia bacterium]|nr:RloB family protein [Clostridia bacterium]
MGRKNVNSSNQRKEFYILTNGEQTEKNYFELIKSKKSMFDVQVKYDNCDPLGLVNRAKQYLKQSNQVWVVFDIDNTFEDNRLIKAINEAKKSGVKYAYSNMAFEVWLISHYIKCEKHMNNKELIKEMDKILDNEKKGLKYDKTDRDLLKKYFINKYDTAVLYSKIVYQKWTKEADSQSNKKNTNNCEYKIWEWNSSTNVFMLIEALKLTNK